MRLNGLRLQVGDPTESLEPARTDAIEQAARRPRSTPPTRAANSARSYRISEVRDQSPTPATSSTYGPPLTASAAFPIQAGQQDLTANVVVVYELK